MDPQQNASRICEHCNEEIVGKPYRVTSEYEGECLLDMTVCAACASVARSLGLRTEEITPQRTIGSTQQWIKQGKSLLRGKVFFLLFILCSLFLALRMPAAAENQTWKVRPGDNLDIIAATLEIPKEEIKNHNPGISESNLQIGQQLKLPLRSYLESKTLDEELGKRDARIGNLERKNSDLEKTIANVKSQLAWHPIWLWGFWICFGIISFVVSGAYWIFRQTHPRVFKEPHERSIRDLRESQTRARPSFSYDGDGVNSRTGQWQPTLKHVPAHR